MRRDWGARRWVDGWDGAARVIAGARLYAPLRMIGGNGAAVVGYRSLLMQAVLKAMLSPFSMFASANTPRRGLTATTSKSYETT